MCTLDELRAEVDEVKRQMAVLTRKGDTAIRKLSAEMGRASSFSHDAKVTSEATHVKVTDLANLISMLHEDDKGYREKHDQRICKLEGFKAQALGVIATVAVFVSAFVSGAAWVIHYAWDWIKGAFH